MKDIEFLKELSRKGVSISVYNDGDFYHEYDCSKRWTANSFIDDCEQFLDEGYEYEYSDEQEEVFFNKP